MSVSHVGSVTSLLTDHPVLSTFRSRPVTATTTCGLGGYGAFGAAACIAMNVTLR
jgi:hypothetical protein